MNKQDVSNDAKILDLLHQIREANNMIKLHRSNGKNPLMLQQYEDLRNRFITDLQQLMDDLELDLLLKKSDNAA